MIALCRKKYVFITKKKLFLEQKKVVFLSQKRIFFYRIRFFYECVDRAQTVNFQALVDDTFGIFILSTLLIIYIFEMVIIGTLFIPFSDWLQKV